MLYQLILEAAIIIGLAAGVAVMGIEQIDFICILKRLLAGINKIHRRDPGIFITSPMKNVK